MATLMPNATSAICRNRSHKCYWEILQQPRGAFERATG
jgi:hypothetical protein